MQPLDEKIRNGLRALSAVAHASPQCRYDRWLLPAVAGLSSQRLLTEVQKAITTTEAMASRGGSAGQVIADVTASDRLTALVDLAREGDAEAFGQLYDHYAPQVHRFLRYRLGSQQVAEDLTSETFFRALRSVRSFRWQGKDFGAWLITIARNLVADHYKSSRYRRESTTDDMSRHDSATLGIEDQVVTAMTNEVLLEAVRQLPAEQQECLMLRFLQGMSITETATALGRSDGAIKQLQLRAVRRLAKTLPDGFR